MRAGLVLMCLLGTACQVTTTSTPVLVTGDVRAVSFNIRYDHGTNFFSDNAWSALSDPRSALVETALSDLDADIVGFQEVLSGQLDDLTWMLPTHEIYAVGRDDGASEGEAAAIAWRSERFERLDAGTYWLSDTPDEVGSQHPSAATVRIASWVVLRDLDAGRELLVTNAHFDHVSQDARIDGAGVVVDQTRRLDPKNHIVLGDFNATEDAPSLDVLTSGLGVADAYRAVHAPGPDERTFHNWSGRTRGSRIDYVLATPSLDVEDAGIYRGHTDQRYPSDHFPVWADFTWAPAD